MPSCDHQWSNVTNCCNKCGISKAHYERWKQGSKLAAMTTSTASLKREIDRLRKRVAFLEGELAWYGDEANHKPVEGTWTEGSTTTVGIRCPVFVDGGARARRARGK